MDSGSGYKHLKIMFMKSMNMFEISKKFRALVYTYTWYGTGPGTLAKWLLESLQK